MHFRDVARLCAVPLLVLAAGCAGGGSQMSQEELEVFASRYASAWSSQDPERFASHYAEDGVLQINDGEPSTGRAEIAATARAYMEAFPDMAVEKDSVVARNGVVTFYWRWSGTNRGPGGTGRPVDMTGYEEWTFGENGRLVRSQGHLDQEEYDRQMGVEE